MKSSLPSRGVGLLGGVPQVRCHSNLYSLLPSPFSSASLLLHAWREFVHELSSSFSFVSLDRAPVLVQLLLPVVLGSQLILLFLLNLRLLLGDPSA